MISVTCKVNSENKDRKDNRQIVVTSVDDRYSLVDIIVEPATSIRVYGDDLIAAIENCMQNGRRRYCTRRYPADGDSEQL